MLRQAVTLLGWLLLSVCAVNAQNKLAPVGRQSNDNVTPPGKKTFEHYCAACHGADARGNGPAAGALKTPPSDLTTLAVRHGGQFPYEYVSDVLRFGKKFSSHGSSDMPIWGPIFSSMEGFDQGRVKKRIKELCDYLASLQQKES